MIPKKNDFGKKYSYPVIGLSMLFMLSERYFLHCNNLKRYLDSLTQVNHPVYNVCNASIMVATLSTSSGEIGAVEGVALAVREVGDKGRQFATSVPNDARFNVFGIH